MNIECIAIGKTDREDVSSLIGLYAKRLGFYVRFSMTLLADVKSTKRLTEKQQKIMEGENILAQISNDDMVVLLDENGDEFSSVEFASWIQKRMVSGTKRLVFVIGGPYGFSEPVYRRANWKISLSRMTFSHQMVRAIFLEQLYRAFTILNNEPYHHA
ncbi:MAG: 23S rRNA (pseudouridine(1915)-N(3))-methyltransferase RlmH [Alistipes sp.]|nr:23S rRNA (pseudouridine(1915)-N(3))-methyltransferase RlmH [Candidatus Alistipes equi]